MVEEAHQVFSWCVENELYEEAMVCLHRIDHLRPGLGDYLEANLVSVLRKHVKNLERSELWDKIAESFQKAFKLFPNSSRVHYELGCFLHRSGNLLVAIAEFKEAIRLNPNSPEMLLCLENAKSLAVDQWHFRMLNDKNRNSSYNTVITHELLTGNCNSVLDIGTGTGILSMMAVQNCDKVYACESSDVMFSICESVLSTNKVAEKIIVYNKSSLQLKVPEDIPEKVSMVITEVFDAGLLGEHVLTTLQHAWENLLHPPPCISEPNRPSGKVIPRSATIFVCLVECLWLRKNQRLITDRFGSLDFSNIDVKLELNEPYNSEHLSQLPGGYKLLTKPVKLYSINFNNPSNISQIIQGCQCDLELVCMENGTVDCVALWFDLELNENLSINTGPESNSCWEQAIFPVVDVMEVYKNELVSLSMDIGEPIKLASLFVKGKRVESNLNKRSIFLGSEWIRKLNSQTLASCLLETLEYEVMRGKSRLIDHQNIPLAALLSAQINGTECTVSNRNVVDKFLELCDCLGLNCDNISFMSIDELCEKSSGTYDVLFYDPLLLSGIFRENIFEEVSLIKRSLLSATSTIYPHHLCLYGMAIDCPTFNSYWKVSDDNVLNFKIANTMNAFQTEYQEDINFNEQIVACLTNHVTLLNIGADEFSIEPRETRADVIRPGVMNSFLYWVELVYSNTKILNTLHCNDLFNICVFSPQVELSLKAKDELRIKSFFTCSIPQFHIERCVKK